MNWDKILSCQNPCNTCKKEWDCITKPENHYDCWEEKEEGRSEEVRKMDKLIQIIPAPAGLYTRTYDDDGNKKTLPLIALGLTDGGGIRLLYLDADGEIREASEVNC